MSEEGDSKSGGGNKGMMMIIMAMLGLIILALVGVAVFLFLNMDALFGGGEEGGDDAPQGIDFVQPGVAPPLSEQVLFDLSDYISTNLGDFHYIRVDNISLGINNIEPDEAIAFIRELASRERAIKDIIHRVLRNTTIEQLNAPEGADRLREDILDALQLAFESPMIVAVYLMVYTIPI